jgi:hypothetical protein
VSTRARLGPIGWWGILGVLALLGDAIYRLVPKALAAFELPFTALEWTTLVVWVAFMAYSEGYRAFYKAFSPRVVARARHLAAHPRPLFAAIAPLYCMGFVHATKRRLIASWCVWLGIVALIVLVREAPQPWHGIIDAGVVVGLTIGALSILFYVTKKDLPVPPDVPDR